MILNNPGAEYEYEGVKYVIGEPIIGTNESEYEGLFGSITEIRDGEDKNTENETPDLYCTFEPPILPSEIKRLEETFSDLYDSPKKLGDIVLDEVIMAPAMVMPTSELHKDQTDMTIYAVTEDWAYKDECGNSTKLFTKIKDAMILFKQTLFSEMNSGLIVEIQNDDAFVSEISDRSYECYIDGRYLETHYTISVAEMPLLLSDDFVSNVWDIHEVKCKKEDFIEQIAEWDELSALSDEQYDNLVNDPDISYRIRNSLSKNDSYWEAYWESVAEVAHNMVHEYSKRQPRLKCFTPEKNNPYPLCVGNGSHKCDECCLYVSMKGEGGFRDD